jgi:hypothetical protein
MRRNSFTFPVSSLAGTTPANIIRILRHHKVEPKFYLKLSLSFTVAAIFGLFRMAEGIFYGKKIKRHSLKENPLFIIGFNRSGTTLLHNLLCQDPRAGYTTTLQTVFPHCFLSQRGWLGPLSNFLVPEKRPFDNVPMNMNFPQEEEFALANLQSYSIYNFFVFPKDFDRILDRQYDPANMSEKGLARWKREYRRMVIKSLLGTGGERYISKNPQNIPRVSLLKELFPGSHFIFIYRDPYKVVESWFNFIMAIFKGIRLQEVPDDFSRKQVARYYALAVKHYFEIKGKPDAPEIMEIRMEDFMKDKIAGLRDIYRFCDMAGFEESLPAFNKYLVEHPVAPHETNHIHADTIRYVNQYAADMVTRLGYPLKKNVF